MVRLAVPFSGMVAAPKALALCGGSITLSVSFDVLLLPASVESMVTLFEYRLSTALETRTVMAHVPTGNVLLEKLMLLVPAVAVTLPPQVFVTLGVEATTRLPGVVPTFVGRLSVKLALIGTTFALVMLKVIVLNELALNAVVGIVLGLKLLAIDGGCNTTRPMLAVLFALPLHEERPLEVV